MKNDKGAVIVGEAFKFIVVTISNVAPNVVPDGEPIPYQMKIKQKIINNKFFYLVIIFIVILYFWIGAKLKLKEIEDSGNILIAKFSHTKKYVKSNDYYFDFFYSNERKMTFLTRVPKEFSKNVGKFYKIKYLEKYPDLIVVEFMAEVTDTIEILKAGFSKEDL